MPRRGRRHEQAATPQGPSAAIRAADPHDGGITGMETDVLRRTKSLPRSPRLLTARRPEQWKGLSILPRGRQRPRHEVDAISAALVSRASSLRFHRHDDRRVLGRCWHGHRATLAHHRMPDVRHQRDSHRADPRFRSLGWHTVHRSTKTESRAPLGHRAYPKGAHTDNPKPGRKPSKCIPKGHIDSAASMYPKGAHNCLPLPRLSKPGKATPEHHCSPVPGSEPRYVLSSDPKAFKEYLGTFERLPLELRMAALGLAA